MKMCPGRSRFVVLPVSLFALVLMLTSCPPPTIPNTAPVIDAISANPSVVQTGGTVVLSVTVRDADGDELTVVWSATGGGFDSNSGREVAWVAPDAAGSYTVTATVSDGRNQSVTDTVTITVQLPSNAVTNFVATALPESVALSWTNPETANFAGAVVRRSTSGAPALPTEGTEVYVGTNESVRDEALTPGTTYFYSAWGRTTSGTYSERTTASATPTTRDLIPPTDVTGLGGNGSDSTVSLSWVAPPDNDLDVYEITFSPPQAGITQPVTVPSRQTSVDIGGLVNTVEYTFTVKSVDTSQNRSSGTSTAVTPTGSTIPTDDTTPPGNVVGLSVTPGENEVALSWSPPSSADFAYAEITFSPTESATSQPIIVPKGTDDATVAPLPGQTVFTFTVRSVDFAGNVSSGVQASTIPTDTTSPGNPGSASIATTGEGTATITWSNPPDFDYEATEITRSGGPGWYRNLINDGWLGDGDTVSVSGTGVKVGGLSGIPYTFTVTSRDSSGNLSAEVSIEYDPTDTTPPAAPDSVTAVPYTLQDGVIDVRWTEATDPDLASVAISVSPAPAGLTQPVSIPAGTSSYRLTGLENGTAYTITLSSIDAVGNESSTVDRSATPDLLLSPADGATDTVPEPSFSWTQVGAAAQYQLQTAESETGLASAPIRTTTGTSAVPAAPLGNSTHYWRVQGVLGDLTELGWSEPRSISIEWTMSGLDPVDGATVTETHPDFSWDAITGAASYEVQIADTEADLDIASTTEVSTNSYTPSTGLTNNAAHVWRVRGADAEGRPGAWSATTDLTVAWGEITGFSPVDGAVTTDTRPSFDWSPVPDATSYDLQIADSEAGVPTSPIISASTDEYTPADPLANNTTHYWRVRARDAEDQVGTWSDIRSLEVAWGSISNTAPTDTTTLTDTTPELSWNAVSDAAGYEVQIATLEADVDTQTPVSVLSPSYTPSAALTNSTTWYWRVRAMDSDGQYGLWTTVTSFSLSWGTITGSSPGGGGTVDDTTPELSWTSIADAAGYEIQIGTTVSAMESATVLSTTTNSYAPASPLTNETTYFWRVRAQDADGQYGLWSGAQEILVDWAGVPTGLNSPDGTRFDPLYTHSFTPRIDVATSTPELTWDLVDGANGYEIQLASLTTDLNSVTPVSAGNGTYAASGLAKHSENHFRVRAYDDMGQYGDWSDPVELFVAKYFIGDSAFGGIVFRISYSYFASPQYAVAMPSDLTPGVPWGPTNVEIGGFVQERRTTLGWGGTITTDIYEALLDWNSGNYAARVAFDYAYGGLGIWYLPSIDELNYMYEHNDVVPNLTAGGYWSSTEHDIDQAYALLTGSGTEFAALKSVTTYSLRLIMRIDNDR